MKRSNVSVIAILSLLLLTVPAGAGFKFFDSTLVDVVEVEDEIIAETWDTAYYYNNGKGAAKIRKSGRCKTAKLALERGFNYMQYEERDNEDWAVSEAIATFIKSGRIDEVELGEVKLYELRKYVVLWECKGADKWAPN